MDAMRVRSIVMMVFLGVCFTLLPALVMADSCQERAAAVFAGKIPLGQDDQDCDAAGRAAALLSPAVAGLAAAAAAAAAAIRVRGAAGRPAHWPEDLKGEAAFSHLGRAIADEPYMKIRVPLPNGGSRPLTDIEKALYVFERMREAARVYGLRAAEGGKLQSGDRHRTKFGRPEEQARFACGSAGALTGVLALKFAAGGTVLGGPVGTVVGGAFGALVGYFVGGPVGARFADTVDPENAGGLRSSGGVGYCGDWTWAFNSVLQGANISNRVIFADKNVTKGTDGDFYSNDTALVIDDFSSGRQKRRVFDIFRELHHDKKNDKRSSWSNLPLTTDDRLPFDDDVTHRNPTWLTDKIKKPYIKDHDGNIIFPQPN